MAGTVGEPPSGLPAVHNGLRDVFDAGVEQEGADRSYPVFALYVGCQVAVIDVGVVQEGMPTAAM
ncbi:hypothetical protein N7U49_47765 (plasmid) [Streptomyces sp. AD2-2]|nr:hypothetical protein N7U49_47765 [Streptomyces sp. AD2-2]